MKTGGRFEDLNDTFNVSDDIIAAGPKFSA